MNNLCINFLIKISIKTVLHIYIRVLILTATSDFPAGNFFMLRKCQKNGTGQNYTKKGLGEGTYLGTFLQIYRNVYLCTKKLAYISA